MPNNFQAPLSTPPKQKEDDTKALNPAGYDYDTIPSGYYDQIFLNNPGIQGAWHRQKFAFLATLTFPSKLHLDVGCGPGTFLGHFAKGTQSIGVDIASDQIAYAQTHYGNQQVEFIQLQNDVLPFADSTFDSISLIELIEHLDLDQLRTLMTEVMRVLKPGGKLVLSTPNYRSLWPLLEWAINKIAHVSYDEQHITQFTPATLEAFLKAYPLQIQKRGSFLWVAPFLAPLGKGFSNWVAKLERHFSHRQEALLLYVCTIKTA